MKTLFLNPSTWDLAVDAYGNIAVAESPYQVAQDVASACRLWSGEARYDTKRGVPYEQILGYLPPASLVSSWYRRESMTVPEVEDVSVTLNFDRQKREASGVIGITLENGESVNVAI